uniref:Uncharacterized protein n=1 Tax=Romanomermis culicivorax TaxID=13658 RepID=A0A915L1L1_ROMCU
MLKIRLTLQNGLLVMKKIHQRGVDNEADLILSRGVLINWERRIRNTMLNVAIGQSINDQDSTLSAMNASFRWIEVLICRLKYSTTTYVCNPGRMDCNHRINWTTTVHKDSTWTSRCLEYVFDSEK